MHAYQAAIDKLVAEKVAERGDTLAFDYFSRHAEETTEGIHLTQQGSDSLATLWAFALARVINSENQKAVPKP